MSIKPIDLQVAIPRTTEVANYQNDIIHRNNALQQHQAGIVEHMAQQNTRQVHTQDKAGDIKFDGREKGNKRGNSEDQKSRGEGGHKEKKGEQPPHGRIDIRI